MIFGASGDLTARKLGPAVENLARHKRIPAEFGVVGVARTEMDTADFRSRMTGADGSVMPALNEGFQYVAGGYDDPDSYRRLRETIETLDIERGTSGNRLFYLATPPEAFGPVIDGLAGAGLNRPPKGRSPGSSSRSPMGTTSAAPRPWTTGCTRPSTSHRYSGSTTTWARTLSKICWRYGSPTRSSSRSGTGRGSTTCKSPSPRLSASALRGSFYEHAGATRDILQNHVLQVLALALMEPPASFEAEAVRNEKVKLLQSIRLPTVDDIDRIAVRGQYTRGGTPDELMPGYRDEPGVNPLSRTETYAALRLDVDNWRWAGVPFYIRTGKRLPKRVTEVALQFQRPPHLPIRLDQATGLSPDALILRIQPDEGITLRFGAKVPGHSFVVRSATMEFNYEATFVEESPEAYERLLLDALIGDPTLFIRSDEVAQCWRIIDPIIGYWADDARSIPLYEAASWGPAEAAACSNATAARGETPKTEHRVTE